MLKRTTYPEVTVKRNKIIIRKSVRSKKELVLTREQVEYLLKVLKFSLKYDIYRRLSKKEDVTRK